MMIEFVWDSGFKRSYKKKIASNKKLKAKFEENIMLFSINPFNPILRTHKLSGILKDCWAFAVDYDCRVIFKFLTENKVLLIDIGAHEEVY
ncbi:MAG: type II toxin-antitoxin system RelE/ParE family toxin [Melioribacteraceae bacterium]